MLLLALVLAVSTFTDLRNRTIPNWLTGVAALAGAGLALHGHRLIPAMLSGLLAAAPFLAANLTRPDGMGMGDVKLAGVLGLFLGSAVWPALVAGLALAGLTGTLVSLGSRREPSRVALPLAPFLALGVALLWAAEAVPLQ